MLKDREGKVVNGAPITAKDWKIRFEEAAKDLLDDYRVNCKTIGNIHINR